MSSRCLHIDSKTLLNHLVVSYACLLHKNVFFSADKRKHNFLTMKPKIHFVLKSKTLPVAPAPAKTSSKRQAQSTSEKATSVLPARLPIDMGYPISDFLTGVPAHRPRPQQTLAEFLQIQARRDMFRVHVLSNLPIYELLCEDLSHPSSLSTSRQRELQEDARILPSMHDAYKYLKDHRYSKRIYWNLFPESLWTQNAQDVRRTQHRRRKLVLFYLLCGRKIREILYSLSSVEYERLKTVVPPHQIEFELYQLFRHKKLTLVYIGGEGLTWQE